MAEFRQATGAAPATPAAGYASSYFDSADKRMKVINELGLVVDLTQAARANNYLINGDFAVCQRLATPTTLTQGILAGVANTYGGYVLDRWLLTCETLASADVKACQTDESANALASAFSMQVQNANAATKRVACSQVLEFKDSYRLRGRNVVFQFKSKISTTARNLRCAIVSAKTSSTKDTFTAAQKDIVNTWSSTTYTTGNFFKATSGVWTYTLVAVSGSLAQTTAYSSVQSITGTVPTDCQNLIVIIWDENGAPTTESMNILEAGLFEGQIAQDWNPRSYQAELGLCRGYGFALPNPNIAGPVLASGATLSTSSALALIPFPVPLRITPTLLFVGSFSHISCQTFANGSIAVLNANPVINIATPNAAYISFASAAGFAAANTPQIMVWSTASAADLFFFDAEL